MKVEIIQFPKILDTRGNLSFIQNMDQIPFRIRRVFWIYDVPGGKIRGRHAYKKQNEVIVALSGSFDVIINDGISEKKFQLNRSYYGLFLPAGTCRHMENFSTNSLSLHLSDMDFNEGDYLRDFNEFKNFINAR